MPLKIVFNKHAIYQLKERGISKSEIVAVISRPNKIIQRSQGKFQAVKRVKRNGRRYLLVAIFRKVNSSKKVITAFLTSKINKYLKQQ